MKVTCVPLSSVKKLLRSVIRELGAILLRSLGFNAIIKRSSCLGEGQQRSNVSHLIRTKDGCHEKIMFATPSQQTLDKSEELPPQQGRNYRQMEFS